MLSKCANPACSAHFLYLNKGRVFRIMRNAGSASASQLGMDPTFQERRQVEFYWLCEKCAATMTVRYRRETGIIVQPLWAALRAAS